MSHNLRRRDIVSVAVVMVVVCAVYRGWDAIVGFLGIVLTAIMPLVIGACIAYVVAIPTRFLERHILPDSTSGAVAALRKPLSIAIGVILFVGALVLGAAVLVPALTETMAMASVRGREFLEMLVSYPVMEPLRDSVNSFLEGELIEGLGELDLNGLFSGSLGGSVANFSNQIFTVVSVVMTGFFGLLFSFILLTDTTDVWLRVMEVMAVYLGPRRAERVALVLGVADATFHNFIVRQFIEAAILGTVAVCTLFLAGYEYALGIGFLMGLAALVPIVGYPVGLIGGAFLVAISDPWKALLYLVVVALFQMIEANFILPHVGDPRTVLPPVWTTVGATIGGGVAGFIGMLVAIPLSATIRQLVLIDVRHRTAAAKGDFEAYLQTIREGKGTDGEPTSQDATRPVTDGEPASQDAGRPVAGALPEDGSRPS